MQWIWSFDQLAKVCRFKKGDVRRSVWAIERLYTLYPEKAADVLLEVIQGGDYEKAQEALKFFDKGEKKEYAETLRELYQQAKGKIAGLMAGILVDWNHTQMIPLFIKKYPGSFNENIKQDAEGYILSLVYLSSLQTPEIKEMVRELFENFPLEDNEYIVPLFAANLRAGGNITKLLEMHLDKPELASYYPRFLETLAGHFGSTLNREEIQTLERFITSADESENEVVEEFKRMLDAVKKNRFWNKKYSLLAMLQKKEYKDIVDSLFKEVQELVKRKKKEVGEETYRKWETCGNERARNNMETIEAFSVLFDRLPSDWHGFMAYKAIIFTYDLIGYQPVIGVILDELPFDRQWELYLQNRSSIVADSRIMAGFKKEEGLEERIEACFKVFETNPDGPVAQRIVRLLCSIPKRELLERLLKIDFFDNVPYLEITNGILSLEPDDAFDMASEIVENSTEINPLTVALNVLADLPMEKTVQLLLDYWEDLYTLDKAYFLMVLFNIADKRFLKKLKTETHDNEELEWETYQTICLLNGIKDPWVKQMGKKVEQYKRDIARTLRLVEQGDGETVLREPVYLELLCRACYRTLNYKVRQIQIVPETLDIYIADLIICKHCNAADHYRVTDKARLVLTPLLALLMNTDVKKEEMNDMLIVPFTAVTVDGKHLSQEEMMEEYHEKLAKEPESPELLIGFGNVLKTVKRSEESKEYFQLAVKIDPNAVDAYIGLGHWQQDRGNYRQAYENYWKAAELIHTGNYYRITTSLEEFKLNMAFMIANFALNHKLPMHPEIAFIVEANQ